MVEKCKMCGCCCIHAATPLFLPEEYDVLPQDIKQVISWFRKHDPDRGCYRTPCCFSIMTMHNQRTRNNQIRGMELLPDEIRKILPPLYAQDDKGGRAIVYVKFFLPVGNWTWWATEGSSIEGESGQEEDFQFFGLAEGFCKELGYFNLSELEEARGPLGLPIERDLHWGPKTLIEIAPGLFHDEQ
jgi:hypothetical protein